MGTPNSSSIGSIDSLRLGFAALLASIFCLSGTFLILEENYWFGGGILGMGVIMFSICHRSYRAFKRPDAARDERSRQHHEQAGFNAFWAIIFGTCLYGFYPIVPTALTSQIEATGATTVEIVWSTSLCFGLFVYITTWMKLSMESR